MLTRIEEKKKIIEDRKNKTQNKLCDFSRLDPVKKVPYQALNGCGFLLNKWCCKDAVGGRNSVSTGEILSFLIPLSLPLHKCQGST